GSGRFVELQATAEGAPFSREEVNDLLDLAETGIRYALERQAAVLQS
ncbi:MAG: ribonuclease PH, partial [Chloroflexi bacterium]|nr:ribonuclease PH [Chloroflexota bacterium]